MAGEAEGLPPAPPPAAAAPASDGVTVPNAEDIEAALEGAPAAAAALNGPNPAEAVIRTFVEALARLARSHRDAVREAGGIAPLVTLLKSGSSEVQGLAAAVLRDLATDNPANRDAILKAGGLDELVEMVRGDVTRSAAGEAAGALRALSAGFPLGCKAICAAGGIEALVHMVRSGKAGSLAPIHATGVLANIAQASETNCEAILRLGGVEQLVSLFSKDSEFAQGRRRVAPEMKQWLERASEEAANALWQLAAKAPSCNAAIREANAIGPLVETLLRSGLDSTTANFSAKALVELIQSDEASKMVALDAISTTAKHENFAGHGWSLSYPLLRHLLQGAAERLLKKEQDGTSMHGITYAIDIGKAVELPQTRIDEARTAFDESAARQKREKMAVNAEERRRAKEEEAAARLAAREEAERKAEEAARAEIEAQGARGRAKRKGTLQETESTNDPSRRRADGEEGTTPERRKPPLPVGARVLLEKIERMAALSRSTTPPKTVVSSEAKEKWLHRWDQKFPGAPALGFEAPRGERSHSGSPARAEPPAAAMSISRVPSAAPRGPRGSPHASPPPAAASYM